MYFLGQATTTHNNHIQQLNLLNTEYSSRQGHMRDADKNADDRLTSNVDFLHVQRYVQ